ncbi:MAG: SIR2 family protein [Bacteroidota bacterium]|nr:SIR2 family protein [Bacteroidota bacterium]
MLERVYELIRKEDVVLWVGAGFSKYAGYPMGRELAKVLYDNLSDEEREDVHPCETFENIAQAYIDFRGTNSDLLKILEKEYTDRTPKSTFYHDELAKVPHIKTIITTNFDCLLENSFQNEAVVIVNDTDIPNIKEDKTTIVKIHGDFANPHRVVVAKTDYANFIQTNLSTMPIWNVVIERMLTKNIVFIGYSIDDINVDALIDKINDALGDKRKDMFFLSPNIPKRKQKWLEQKNIIPIQMTGEDFVMGLIKNLEDNLLIDLEKGAIPHDTCKKYLDRRDVYGTPIYNRKGFSINQLFSDTKEIKTQITFTISDDEIIKLLSDKRNTEDVTIPKDKIIELDGRSDGMKIPISDKNNLKEITLKPIPIQTYTDFNFENSDYNTYNVRTNIFTAEKAVRFEFCFTAGVFTIKVSISDDGDDIKIIFMYQRTKEFNRPIDEIEYYKFLYGVFKGEKFTLVTQTGRKLDVQAHKIKKELVEEFKKYLDYFTDLHTIETHYKIVFDKTDKFTSRDIQNASFVANSIKGNTFEANKELYVKLELTPEAEEQVTMNIDDNKFEAYLDEVEEVTIHGYRLVLGKKKLVINNPIYSNHSEAIEKISKGKAVELIIFCKPNTMFITYE